MLFYLEHFKEEEEAEIIFSSGEGGIKSVSYSSSSNSIHGDLLTERNSVSSKFFFSLLSKVKPWTDTGYFHHSWDREHRAGPPGWCQHCPCALLLHGHVGVSSSVMTESSGLSLMDAGMRLMICLWICVMVSSSIRKPKLSISTSVFLFFTHISVRGKYNKWVW